MEPREGVKLSRAGMWEHVAPSFPYAASMSCVMMETAMMTPPATGPLMLGPPVRPLAVCLARWCSGDPGSVRESMRLCALGNACLGPLLLLGWGEGSQGPCCSPS